MRLKVTRQLKGVSLASLALFLAIQVYRPAKSNPAVEPARAIHAHMRVTPEASAILERACRDCHSNQTRWPWYSHVAPLSWWLTDHVNHARTHLNFSEWAKYNRSEAEDLLDAMCKEASTGAMPLPSYLVMHRNARLSPQDARTLCEWTRAASERLAQETKR